MTGSEGLQFSAFSAPPRATTTSNETMRLRTRVAALTLLATPAAAQSPRNPAVDRVFAQWDRPDSPGCAVGAAQNGRFVYQRGYGMANLDYDLPNGPNMVYYVGSDSKQFTAAAIALLALD